jgi:hypothetical protein
LNIQHRATPTSRPGRVPLDRTTAAMAAAVDRLTGPGATKLWTSNPGLVGTVHPGEFGELTAPDLPESLQ